MKFFSWRSAILKSNLPSTTKLVLLVLSTYMDDHGSGAFPSMETIAENAGLSKRSVVTQIGIAVDAGFISVSKHGFSGQKWKRNEYHIAFPQITEPVDNEWMKAIPQTLATSDHDKNLAQQAVTNALKRGDLVRGCCAACNSPKAEAHHFDYSRRLDVIWLCKKHHNALHVAERLGERNSPRIGANAGETDSPSLPKLVNDVREAGEPGSMKLVNDVPSISPMNSPMNSPVPESIPREASTAPAAKPIADPKVISELVNRIDVINQNAVAAPPAQNTNGIFAMFMDWIPGPNFQDLLAFSRLPDYPWEDELPEFVLYRLGQSERMSQGAWEHKFIQTLKRNAVRRTLQGNEPTQIPNGWEPSRAVIDALCAQGITRRFLDDELFAFVTFWREAGTPQLSWTAKFINHVRQRWATQPRPQMSTFDSLTDRSWAAGLVPGLEAQDVH